MMVKDAAGQAECMGQPNYEKELVSGDAAMEETQVSTVTLDDKLLRISGGLLGAAFACRVVTTDVPAIH